ncbi:MAG: hypothetical protein ACTSQA_07865 [Candidatus Heimdallarchaeaceae archaeon]
MPNGGKKNKLTADQVKEKYKDSWKVLEAQGVLMNPETRKWLQENTGKAYPNQNVSDFSYGGTYDKLDPDFGDSTVTLKKQKKPRMGGSTGGWEPYEDVDPNVVREQAMDAGDTGGSGGGVGGTTTDAGDAGGTGIQIDSSTGEIIGLGDADLASFQRTYDYLKNLEDPGKFEFDDTYAPDQEGFRDVAGYLMDAGKTVLGTFGATEKMSEYTPSSDFQLMLDESRNRRNLGLTQEARSEMENRMQRGYAYDVKNIRDLSGGSGGTALANLGGASARYYDAQNQMNMLDEQLKMANRDKFYQTAIAGEQVNRQIFDDKRQIEMLNKQAAGELVADSLDNIQHRKEYEDTYLNPNSPYYQYRKEMVLDTRLNRMLKEEAEKTRLSEADKFLLDVENQMQEKIEGIETAKKGVKEDINNELQKDGKAPIIESSEDFKNYDGQPVVDINQPVDENLIIPGVSPQIANNPFMEETLGFKTEELNDMSDTELSEKGIERSTHTVVMKDANGNDMPPITYNTYGVSTPMDDGQPKSMNDQEFLDLEDDVNKEFAQEEQKLLDDWYLKNEKKYNKLKEELDNRKKEPAF